MAATTEQIAIWILRALKDEWERDPSLLTCRTEAVVLGPFKAEFKISDTDIDRGMNFLVSRGMLKAVNRKDGRAACPSERGFQHLASHDAAKKQEAYRKQDVRLKIYPIIIAILAAWIAYLSYKLRK